MSKWLESLGLGEKVLAAATALIVFLRFLKGVLSRAEHKKNSSETKSKTINNWEEIGEAFSKQTFNHIEELSRLKNKTLSQIERTEATEDILYKVAHERGRFKLHIELLIAECIRHSKNCTYEDKEFDKIVTLISENPPTSEIEKEIEAHRARYFGK